MNNAGSENLLVEHFFRQEYGRLVASLVRFFGVRHFDLVEDMVQAALAEALLAWKQRGAPDNPTAWIHRVAKNRVLDVLRREQSFQRKLPQLESEDQVEHELSVYFEEDEIRDSQLRLLFVCCHPDLPSEATIPLTLKMVCGFGEKEIANGLLVSEAAVRKRIYRAKRALVGCQIDGELPSVNKLSPRLETVHHVLYLMFNAGYAASQGDNAIRMDICEEAARLCHMLAENPALSNTNSYALLSLMLFHGSRFDARIDPSGCIVLLEEQDRSQWDRPLMRRAAEYFQQASESNEISSYHLEAAIALQHCMAPSFQETDWNAIVGLYDRLLENQDSPVLRMNRAIAVGQRDGHTAALAMLSDLRNDPRLAESHLLDAAFGECLRQAGDRERAAAYFKAALAKVQTAHERSLLERKLVLCKES